MSGYRFADGIDRTNHLNTSIAGSHWAQRVLLLAATAILASPGAATAQSFWGWGGGPAYSEREVAPPPRRMSKPKAQKKHDPAEARAKAAAKPQGPLVIAVSLATQRVKVYDSNGLFAESPVSSGTRSHPTPGGVFSIIQKNKHHVSNLYYAKMPYMQRITWSGVALHTGALPGFAASHGCIRLPNEFAARLWTWTKMGTRVIVSHGEVSPVDINHAKLIARMTPVLNISAIPAAGTSAGLISPDKRDARAQIRTADAADTILKMQGKLSDASSAAPDEKAAAHAEAAPVELKNVGIDSAGDRPAQTAAGSDKPAATIATEKSGTVEKPADIAKPVDAIVPSAPADAAKPVIAAKSRANSHVAVFISRKDRKLYVRQGYEPVFDTPIEITDIDRPLGTHVFTASNAKDDAQGLHWTVVSIPQSGRGPEPKPVSGKNAKAKVAPVVVPASQMPSATEALDRIVIPAEAQEKIAAIIAPGGSVLISDHGVGWETGRGTDFIVPIR